MKKYRGEYPVILEDVLEEQMVDRFEYNKLLDLTGELAEQLRWMRDNFAPVRDESDDPDDLDADLVLDRWSEIADVIEEETGLSTMTPVACCINTESGIAINTYRVCAIIFPQGTCPIGTPNGRSELERVVKDALEDKLGIVVDCVIVSGDIYGNDWEGQGYDNKSTVGSFLKGFHDEVNRVFYPGVKVVDIVNRRCGIVVNSSGTRNLVCFVDGATLELPSVCLRPATIDEIDNWPEYHPEYGG